MSVAAGTRVSIALALPPTSVSVCVWTRGALCPHWARVRRDRSAEHRLAVLVDHEERHPGGALGQDAGAGGELRDSRVALAQIVEREALGGRELLRLGRAGRRGFGLGGGGVV